MKKVDYDQNQYKNYQQGRAHSAETIRLWMDALAKYLPRPIGYSDTL
ncbi:hypothetical protein J4G02_00465 [Candidatus Poribacteria bacterium]|nr:hypothetical protein [Candidatus Poribacteria bacterium]